MIVRHLNKIVHCYLKLAILAIVGMYCSISFAQTNISGVINNYIDITAINYGTNSVTASSAAAFAIGDSILLIQMKGANMDEADAASFGTINSYDDAGNYEFLVICDIVGNEITFDKSLMNTYTPSGLVQLISVPNYNNAIIAGANLTAAPWNGVTGGVLVLDVAGTLDFGTRDIDLRNAGFRGGASILSNGACSFSLDASYYKPFTDPAAKALKGEGIREVILDKETGRGPQVNGGSAGNNHNGGGGGGANYGYGGRGGIRVKKTAFTCGSVVGVDSKDLVAGYTANKIFMGGGGGAGNGNNGITPYGDGQNGAGIVIIRAGTISGNGRTIFANGTSVPGNSDSDGGGGGGAGGTVFLETATFSNILNVNVSGGNGASVDDFGTSNCNGPGGGGGGGLVWVNLGAVPGNLVTTLNGGAPGIIAQTGQLNCVLFSTNQAVAGNSGAVLTSLVINESSVDYAGCNLAPLPIEFLDFTYTYDETFGTKLMWSTATEHNNDYFTVYRSVNGGNFQELGKVDGSENSLELLHYSLTDPFPAIGINYYRLTQTDLNGHEIALKTISVNVQKEFEGLIIAPNPVRGNPEVSFTNGFESEVRIAIYKATGELVHSRTFIATEGLNKIQFDSEPFSSGVYLLVISGNKQTKRIKFVK